MSVLKLKPTARDAYERVCMMVGLIPVPDGCTFSKKQLEQLANTLEYYQKIIKEKK